MPPHRIGPLTRILLCSFAAVTLVSCAGGESTEPPPPGSGGATETGGHKGSGGATSTGGTTVNTGSGGAVSSGGATSTGGKGSGGVTSTGGASSTGGAMGGGGRGIVTSSGGAIGMGGRSGPGVGGATARGGSTGRGGGPAMTTGSGGSTGAGGAAPLNCMAPALTGGMQHCSGNASGKVGSYTWTIWSSTNSNTGCLTTYDTTAAFSATWNNIGDFLARVGLQWDRSKTYDQLGTVSADISFTKTGTAGGYSYVGIYGWSVSPTIEFYIVEDSFNRMPVNPGGTKSGTAMIDGDTYDLYTRQATGASIDGSSSFTQFYSVRHTARQCGHISISDHFAAWAKANMKLGKMEEAKILVEAGGGSGSASFTSASITVQ